MVWVCVNENGNERICEDKPFRHESKIISSWWGFPHKEIDNHDIITLPKGSIKKLIGRNLSWADEPVELKEDNPYSLDNPNYVE